MGLRHHHQDIARTTADVLFLIDEVSFLFSDTAEQGIPTYEAAGAQPAPAKRLLQAPRRQITGPAGVIVKGGFM